MLASNVPNRLGRDLERWDTLVVESDARIVGLGALDRDEVKRVYVDPAAQGGGAATALVCALEEIAAEHVDAIRIEASPSSVGFYEALGFVRVADDRLEIGKATFRFVRMTKELGRSDQGRHPS